MGIKVNYTAYCINNWREIMLDGMIRLKKHLLDNYKAAVSVFAYPYSYQVNEVLAESGVDARIIKCPRNEYEFPALRDLAEDPDDLNLYFHTKGVTHPLGHGDCRYWRDFMTHFNIDRCSYCIENLQWYDAVGVAFKGSPWPHFSGNFWWATRSHLLAADRSYLYRYRNTSRWDAERFICANAGRYLSMCSVPDTLCLSADRLVPDIWDKFPEYEFIR